jgi:hypothetical protein
MGQIDRPSGRIQTETWGGALALRDIFDGDPRSKDQLREEIRVQGKVILDLSQQVDTAKAQAINYFTETEELRRRLQSAEHPNRVDELNRQASNLTLELEKLRSESDAAKLELSKIHTQLSEALSQADQFKAKEVRLQERERAVNRNFDELLRREGLLKHTDKGLTPREDDLKRQTHHPQLSNIEVAKAEVSAHQKQLHQGEDQNISRLQKQVESLQSQLADRDVTLYPTFAQEGILSWMFSQTSPDHLQIDHGYLHLMGDGPWDNNTFALLMEGQDFSLWKLPDADIAHLVVGRNNWSEDDLLAQIEARQGQELRIYSQEMWFATMATGRDPFDADDTDLLLAFAKGHEALEFLIGLEMPWPNVADHPQGQVNTVEVSELGVAATPMRLMGYRVGETSPHSEEERRAILHEIFCSKNLPFGDDCSAEYRSNWGTPKSAQRLYRMASHIKFIVDGPNGSDYRRPVAREDWVSDLAWLKKTYFKKTVHAFKWPSTQVP